MCRCLWSNSLLGQDILLEGVTCQIWNAVGQYWGFFPSQARKLAHEAAGWLVSQGQYTKWDLLQRKERLQLEQCSGAQKLVAPCSGEGWGFLWTLELWVRVRVRWVFSIGHGFTCTGFLQWASLFASYGRKQPWEHSVCQSCGRFMRPCICSSWCRNPDL
jgi:hypothetical protein